MVFLDINAEGKVTKTLEFDEDDEHMEVNYVPAPMGATNAQLVLEYKSTEGDRDWAQSDIVATVGVEESLLSVQQRVEDAMFMHVEVIPMGVDKVFLHCNNNEDMMQVFNEEIDFFSLLFSAVHHWTSTDTKYERGAWVCVYGTPIHAWNTNFFKLCVSECGRFVRTVECTLD